MSFDALISGLVLVSLGTSCMPGLSKPTEGPAGLGLLLDSGMLANQSKAPAAAIDSSEKLSLSQAFQLALARSEQVSIAQAGVRDADIRWKDSWSTIKPTADLTAQALLQRERVVTGMGGMEQVLTPGEQLIYGARVAQPLFRRGFLASRAAGKYGHDSANATLERAREQLARDVAEVFIAVLRSRKLLELARASVVRTKAQAEHAVNRVKAGSALKSAELLAMVDVRRSELQAITGQRDVDAAGVAFQRLTGREPPPELELPTMPAVAEKQAAAAIAKRRNDVVSRQASVQAARSEQEAAEGRRWWPRLDLQASVQFTQPQVFGRSVDWFVIGLLTVPLLQSGREHTDVALRENAARIAGLELEQQQKIAVEEIELAAILVASAAEGELGAKKQLDAASEHYKLVDKQFRLGAITFLEVTNAQSLLVEAENAYEVARVDKVRALFDYQFATGALDFN
jgi:outer membrane protein